MLAGDVLTQMVRCQNISGGFTLNRVPVKLPESDARGLGYT